MCGSATPRPRWCCPGWTGDLAGLLAEVGRGRARPPCPGSAGERRGLRGAGLARAIRGLPAPETSSTAWRMPRRWTGSPSSMPARPIVRRRSWWWHGAGGEGRRVRGSRSRGDRRGRVLDVTALGATLDQARCRAYRGVSAVSWPGMQCTVRHRPVCGRRSRSRIGARPAPPVGAGGHDTGSCGDPPLRAPETWPSSSPTRPASPCGCGSSCWPPRGGPRWGMSRPMPPRCAGPRRPRSTRPSSRRWPSGSGSPITTSPPSSTWCRTAIGQPEGSWIHYGLTSSDVVDTALCATLTRASRPAHRGMLGVGVGVEGPGPRVHRHPGDRPDPRDARRADHLRGQVLVVGVAGRPRPPAPPGRPPEGGGGQAVRRGRDLFEHRPSGGGPCLCGPRPHPDTGHPGGRPRPARRVPLGLRVGGCHHRVDRHRGPAHGPQ